MREDQAVGAAAGGTGDVPGVNMKAVRLEVLPKFLDGRREVAELRSERVENVNAGGERARQTHTYCQGQAVNSYCARQPLQQ